MSTPKVAIQIPKKDDALEPKMHHNIPPIIIILM